jgi:hypothetical protein
LHQRLRQAPVARGYPAKPDSSTSDPVKTCGRRHNELELYLIGLARQRQQLVQLAKR